MSEQQSQGPPQFRPQRPAGKADTAIPAKERDEDTDEEDANVLVRALRKVLGLGQHDAKDAGTWILLRFAVLMGLLGLAYIWTHSMWGWGPCPHRQHLEILREFKPELMAPQSAPQPQGRPPIIAPTGGR